MSESTKGMVPKLSWWLTRDEFQLVYAYQWVAFYRNVYGVEDMPPQAADEIHESFGKAFRWAIAKLAVCHGMRFTGLNVSDEGTISLKSERPVEPRNEYFIWRLLRGSQPHPGAAIETALRMRALHELTFDEEPMRAELKQIREDIRQAVDSLAEDPELAEQVKREAMEVAREMGWSEETN